jgi:hypothetical protein
MFHLLFNAGLAFTCYFHSQQKIFNKSFFFVDKNTHHYLIVPLNPDRILLFSFSLQISGRQYRTLSADCDVGANV